MVPLCAVLLPPPKPENKLDDCCGCDEVAVEEDPNKPPPPALVAVFCCCPPPRDPNMFDPVFCVLPPPNRPPEGLGCAVELPRFEKRPPPVFPGALVAGEEVFCVFPLPLVDVELVGTQASSTE